MEGAWSSLVWSTFNVKVCWAYKLELLDGELLLLLLDEGCSSAQGTGISLPRELDEELDSELVVLLSDDCDWLSLVELVPDEDPEGELAPPILLREITAKSIFPELGLTMTSSMRPMRWPEESCTSALMSLLPRTACCELRPVELS